jgi:hypothetical protein
MSATKDIDTRQLGTLTGADWRAAGLASLRTLTAWLNEHELLPVSWDVSFGIAEGDMRGSSWLVRTAAEAREALEAYAQAGAAPHGVEEADRDGCPALVTSFFVPVDRETVGMTSLEIAVYYVLDGEED